MEITHREFWMLLHGIVLGVLYLLAFAGGLNDLVFFQPNVMTRRVRIGMWSMCILSWLIAISGTYWVYPWYRELVPTSPRSLLLADPAISTWHTFGMEWKEHIGWLSPIMMTCVAYFVSYFPFEIAVKRSFKIAVITLFLLSFLTAAIAAIFGALITKVAPL